MPSPRNRNDRWISQTGLKLIRIVIGSYFMAVSLDLVHGLDQRVMFLPMVRFELADIIGSTLLLFLSVLFMTGLYLRLTSLTLALFVLACSILENFVQFDLANVSDFWRDLTLACAVMLNYSALGRREMRQASVLGPRVRKQDMSHALGDNDGVMPRRVTLIDKPKRPAQTDIRKALLSSPERPRRTSSTPDLLSDEETENIFVNI